MISPLIKEVMRTKGLTVQGLADALGVSLDRAKSLSSGRVKKLDPAEVRALVERLGVSSLHIATGEGPVFAPPAEQQLADRLLAIRRAAMQLEGIDLPAGVRADLLAVLVGVENGDADLLVASLDRLALQVKGGETLTADEAELIQHYRGCDDAGRALVGQTVAMLGKKNGKGNS